ncbi:Serine/threonine protein kinase [Thermobacillus xylanilyticus]|uniref:Serine/threonine protein kinase n=1 Tax=Thermobacillus xylanilyticus TaxID=76633 RepID=A0ABN7S1C0_THEXY|nr:protein kinase [Thermobacillus xylanilyticus]REJ14410.1 MAG: serine/threonine protein kinase [Paenibacillaceae bacterium]CAG5088862.1 Serine/threonine protein kinase [Thermobacillus xylanilyticus]
MKTSSELRLAPGTVITGKWNRGRYRVERLLGEGANGKVYLVEHSRRLYAMKVGGDAVDLQSEINVLRSLASRRRRTEPFLLAVDDYVHRDGKEYPFYIMRYVRGSVLHEYLQREGADWFPLVGYNLLGKLAELHEAGFVFGDLKRENVLVGSYGRVELVDYGGATAIGKSVRQFTELYDRGYWNAGSRTAEGTYDLFSFAVLCLHLFEGRRLLQLTKTLLPQNRSPADLIRLTTGHPALKPFAGWLARALGGEFASAREGAAAWQRIMYGGGVKPARRRRSTAGWAAGLFACTMIALAAAIVWMISEGMLPTGLS